MFARQMSTLLALGLWMITSSSVGAVEFTISDDGQTKIGQAGEPVNSRVQTVDVTVPAPPNVSGPMDLLAPPQAANGYPDRSIPVENILTPPVLPDVTVPLENTAIRDPAAAAGSYESDASKCFSCGQMVADGSCTCGLPEDGIAGAGCSSDCLGSEEIGAGTYFDDVGGCSNGCGCGSGDYSACGGCGCGGACATGMCGGCKDKGGWFLDMWVASGYTYNNRTPVSNSNLPLTFNDRHDKFMMNQLYASFGKAVSTSTWDIGGRVDVLYGTDYFFTTALGLETRQDGSPHWNSSIGPRGTGASLYGVALPQAYFEIGIPIGAGTSVSIGHFYTILGYESVMAPENFFYSHAFTMQYGEPFTHSGVLIDQAITQSTNVLFGVTMGWDNWDNPNDKAGYLAGFSWCPSDKTSLAFGLSSSQEDPLGTNNRTVYSMVLTHQLTDRLQYVFQHDFGTEALGETDLNLGPDSAKWYGINQYFFYQTSPSWTWGARIEWFRDQDNARVLGIPSESLVEGGNYVELTLGANYRPTCKWIFRPEIRWDWSDVKSPALTVDGMFNDFTDDSQVTLAFDFIFRF